MWSGANVIHYHLELALAATADRVRVCAVGHGQAGSHWRPRRCAAGLMAMCTGKTTLLRALQQPQAKTLESPQSSNTVAFAELVLDKGGRATQVQRPAWKIWKPKCLTEFDGRLRLLLVDMPGQLQCVERVGMQAG